jgi:outer membrane receptor protein involved in Fe transport
MNRTRTVLFFLAWLLLFSSQVYGQNIYGSITGRVTDPSGATVPNAAITAINTATNARFATVSSQEGVFTLPALPVGTYNLTVEAPGFRTYTGQGIQLQVNETARVDVALAVGSASETVTVAAEVVRVETTSSTLKTVVDQKRIAELPLNGRNATQLMRLVVGTTTDFRADATSGTTYPGVTPVSVNGNRANTTNYMLDGAQNNDHYTNAPNPMPNPDALQEFSVQTNSFSAEFGRQSGGVVNAITKSGTNELHGSAFWFVRNNALNADPYFAAVRNGVRQDDGLKRNQFGATIGGPVLIPRIYGGKDRTFFFFSYQGTIERRRPPVAQIVVPTAAQRRGDFSNITRALRDPFGGGTYPNNQIPPSQMSSISQEIMKFIPLPTVGNTITTSAPNNFDDNQYLVRIDHQLSSRNRLTGRFWDSQAEVMGFLNPTNYLESVTGRTWLNRSVNLTDTHTFGATLINQAMFAFNRTDGNNVPVLPARSIASLGANYYNDDKPQWHVTVVGYFGTLNTGDTNRFLRDEFQFIDTVRWTKGRHQLTFGGEYSRGIGDVRNNFRANGQWNFNGVAPFTTDSLADFYIGRFNTLVQGIGEYRDTRFNRISIFAQDEWKLTTRLNLNLGIRWEPFLPFIDLRNRLAVWRPGERSTRFPNAPLGIIYAGDPQVPRSAINARYNYFAPRIGFAYALTSDGKTSLRGGYGIFFDQLNTIALNNQANQAPFGTVVTTFGNLNNSFANPYAGITNPFPAPLDPPSNTTFPNFSTHQPYVTDFQGPYVQSWNLTLEREVGFGFIARTSYAASKGTRLGVVREGNAAVFVPGATTATTNQRRPFAPGLGNLSLIEPTSNSTFHALQFTLERRFSKGVSVLGNYQFSKAIDDASATKLTGQARTNPFNQRFDKGPADFDKTHIFNFSGLWELPMRTDNGFAKWIVNGWSLNAIASLMSGPPFTVTSGVDNARTGTGGQRADMIGDPNFSGDRERGQIISEYLRKSAFAPNAIGTFGNLGRNRFRAPGFANWDFGLFKSFPIYERFMITYRFEAFNAFNRPNLGIPVSAQNNVNFMRITSAFDQRILQMALRMTW